MNEMQSTLPRVIVAALGLGVITFLLVVFAAVG